MLPNDPLFRELSVAQIQWIVLNMNKDAEEMDKQLNSIDKKSNNMTASTTLSDTDFAANVAEHLEKLRKVKEGINGR